MLKTKVDSGRILDVQAIRADFPILKQKMQGKPLIYLDNAATSQKPQCVIDAINEYYTTYNANIHRGIYEIAEKATGRYEEGRRKVARFINARSSKEIIFTRNTTEAINLVAHSWGRTNIGEGNVIVLTEMEHHSNLIPWQILAKEQGAQLEFVEVDNQGLLNMDHLDELLKLEPRLLAFTHMSNVLGTVVPAKEIIEKAHAAGALTLVDGAQSVPHLPVDVQDLEVDFLAFSSHKMLGPTGIGALYARRQLLEEMPPFLGGGEMIRRVGWREAQWNELPWKYEAGTPSIMEGIAWGAAIDYLSEQGMEAIHRHEQELAAYALERLRDVEGLEIYGPPAERRAGVVAFTLGDLHAHDISAVLDREGIATRAGHHCTMPLHDKLGVAATTRASFYLYNTKEEIDKLAEGLEKTTKVFGK